MLVKGELKCLHCGHASGDWAGPSGTPLTLAGYRGTHAIPGDPSTLLRCVRCAGPVYLDEASAVSNSYRLHRIRRLRAQLAAYDARVPRRAA
jgi:hypothetical protein